ncbi:MAG TPA: TolC family protein [Burkholderiales bacterium]|nr:TolC family protein [Burkholderiales bacterium]
MFICKLPHPWAGKMLLSLAFAVQALAAFGQSADLGALTLSQAEQLLRSHNRELQAARRAVEAAQANTLSASARPNPTLSLGIGAINPSVGVGAGPLRDKFVDSSIRIDQIIERGDRRELRVANARSLESASTEDLSAAVRQQRLALRAAYYDLLLAQDKVGIARDTTSLFEGSLKAAELRLKAGDIASADVARLRVDALRALNDARAAEADRRRAQLALAYLIGAEAQAADIRAADPWPSLAVLEGAGVADELIERRPDVRAARNRVEGTQKARDLARSLRTRDLTVGAQFDHYPVNPSYASGSGAGNGNSYGVFMSIPLFAGYYYEGEIQRAEVDYNAALEALDKVRAQARAELSRTLSDLQAAAERLQRYDESLLVEAKKASDSVEFAYKNGAVGVMDLLDARRTLRAIQIDSATARSDYSKALAAWEAGTQRLGNERQ